MTQTLDNNPNLGCSRLLCPRRLKANTRYTACLIPAFEKGRLAGIGKPEAEIDETPNALASWPAKEAVSGAVQFPVYYEWEFSTTDAGDFEDLARLLQPLDPKELDPDANLLDLQEPGWGLRYRSTRAANNPVPSCWKVRCAYQRRLSQTLRLSRQPVGKDAADEAFSKALSDLLNLGVEPVADQAVCPQPTRKPTLFSAPTWMTTRSWCPRCTAVFTAPGQKTSPGFHPTLALVQPAE